MTIMIILLNTAHILKDPVTHQLFQNRQSFLSEKNRSHTTADNAEGELNCIAGCSGELSGSDYFPGLNLSDYIYINTQPCVVLIKNIIGSTVYDKYKYKQPCGRKELKHPSEIFFFFFFITWKQIISICQLVLQEFFNFLLQHFRDSHSCCLWLTVNNRSAPFIQTTGFFFSPPSNLINLILLKEHYKSETII